MAPGRLNLSLHLTSILLAAIVVRLVVCYGLNLPSLTYDSRIYIEQARAIGAGEWQNFMPNGYPLVLAAIPFPAGSPGFIRAAQFLNVICGTLVVALVYLTSRALHLASSTALAATLAAAVWPHQVNYVRFVLTEVPSTFLLALAIWGCVTGRAYTCGVAVSCAAVLRTTLLPLAFLAPLVMMPSAAWAQRFRAWGASALVLAAFVGTASQSGHSGLGANLAMNVEVARLTIDGDLRFDAPTVSTSAAFAGYLDDLRRDPGRFLKQRLQSANELWGPYPAERSRGPARRLVIGLRFPLLLLAIVGFRRLRDDPRRWALVVPALVVSIIHILLFSTARFSYPFEPQMIVLAAAGARSLAGVSAESGNS